MIFFSVHVFSWLQARPCGGLPLWEGARGGMSRTPFLEENVERIDNMGKPTVSHVRAIVCLESSKTKTEPNWRLLSSDSMELAQ